MSPVMKDVWRHLPAPARPIAAAADAAITAARERDREALTGAAGELAAQDAAQVGLILGTTVRLLLEDRHPDGLTGEDVRAVLTSCVASATEWQSEVDPHVVLFLLAGALGVHDDDGSPPPRPSSTSSGSCRGPADHGPDLRPATARPPPGRPAHPDRPAGARRGMTVTTPGDAGAPARPGAAAATRAALPPCWRSGR